VIGSVARFTVLGPITRPVGWVGRGIDRRAREMLAGPGRQLALSALDATLAGVDGAVRSPFAQDALDRVLGSALADDLLDRLVARAADSPEAERAARRVIDSRLFDAVLRQLLESEGLWLLVDEIAGSPAVTNAISQQSVGFANQMAGVVRDRSRTADDRLERLARRFTRRAARSDAPAVEAPGAAGSGAVAPGVDGPAAVAPGVDGPAVVASGVDGPGIDGPGVRANGAHRDAVPPDGADAVVADPQAPSLENQ
jgi:hypothetical protein